MVDVDCGRESNACAFRSRAWTRWLFSRPPTAQAQQCRRIDSGSPAAEEPANHGSCRGPNRVSVVAVCSLLALYRYIPTLSVLGGDSGEIDKKSKEFKNQYILLV